VRTAQKRIKAMRFRIGLVIINNVLVILFLVSPLVWVLRDGLGPGATDSSGFSALYRFAMTFYFGPVVITILILRLLIRQMLKHHYENRKEDRNL
jgi:hypothetical protein